MVIISRHWPLIPRTTWLMGQVAVIYKYVIITKCIGHYDTCIDTYSMTMHCPLPPPLIVKMKIFRFWKERTQRARPRML